MPLPSSFSRFLYSRSPKQSPSRNRGRQRDWALLFESLERRELLSAIGLNDFSVSQGTGEKPQSKAWEYAGQWWSVVPNSTGSWLWRLDGTSWTPSLRLSTNKNVHEDVKSVGDVTHVLLFDGSATQLASVQYVAATNS